MCNPFRAGLVGFVLALILVLTSAAPIILKQVSSPAHFQGAAPHYLIQKPSFDVAHRSSDIVPKTVEISDGMVARELVTMYRRTSLGTRIKEGIKHVFHRIGEGVKTAVQKVGHFVHTTGAKIAKVGLKIWSTATKALSKVAQFIPVIGKPLSKAMDAAGTIENKASNAIHANLGKGLNKAMHRMDKGQKVMGYIPREFAESSEERGFGELDRARGWDELPLDDVHGGSRPFSTSVASPNGVVTISLVTLYRRKSIVTKIKNAIKHVVHSVGHLLKTTVAKVAKFVPVVGKPLSKYMQVESAVANKGSDMIHANIKGKLGQAMHRMDKGQKVMGYIPRELAEILKERSVGKLDERVCSIRSTCDCMPTPGPIPL
ncbi:hypothetical protein HYPSUDRAFT_220112 [Hypholoma sublateritium FD-334 SS-4]|uniref:Senescence domain-containing protein n=1 Tax=Hypholoma sublateritium (strain FD-334 SS-4) TaxID=945553 RepID=A0A0D2N875_HYPSF|nr:hypothetical protein HYPSUDRAFT_220112 [Hypholoma sublateritium FD-334 SS-4]